MQKTNKIYVIIILLIIFLAGMFLRLHNLGEASYWIDEGFSLTQAEAIIDNGYPLLDSKKIEIKDPLFSYLLVPLVWIWGIDNAFEMRILAVLCGGAVILIAYFIGKEMENDNLGLMFSFFTAFSYWYIVWSKQVRSYSLLILFIFLVLFFLVLYEKRKKDKYLFGIIISILGASLSKIFGALLFIPFLFYLFSLKKWKWLGVVFMLLAIFIFFFWSFLLNALRGDLVNYFGFYLINYFWFSYGILFSVAIVGLIIAFKKDKLYRRLHFFNLGALITPFIFFSFFFYVQEKRYLLILTPFLFFYTAYFIYEGSSFFKKKKLVSVLILGIIVGLDVLTVKSLIFLPARSYDLENYTPQPNFKKAYSFIEIQIKETDWVISPYPYMDLIYLKKADYALPISYTGLVGDISSHHSSREYYSGVKMLYGKDPKKGISKIKKLQKKGDVYVFLDEMALRKLDDSFLSFVRKDGQLIFSYLDLAISKQEIRIYRFWGE